MEENLFDKNKEARTTRKFIEEQLLSLKERLADAENKLKDFDEKVDGIHIIENIQRQLSDKEFALQGLLQRYTEKHPLVIRIKEEIAAITRKISALAQREMEYNRLKKEVEANRKIHDMLRERLEEVRISEAEKVSDVSIIDPAMIPADPINTQSTLSIPLGAFLGLIMGLILAIIVENLDASIGTMEDVENIIKLAVLGVIPSVLTDMPPEKNILKRISRKIMSRWNLDPETERYVRLLVFHKPSSPIAESFRNIRTNIMQKNPPKTVMITSSHPKEGKTSLVTNLCLTISQEGQKVLLVASDMRRPAISNTFGISSTPGLSDILTGTATLDDSVKGLSDMIMGNMQMDELIASPAMKNLWILPSGKIPSYPAELLSSKEMDRLIEEMTSKYDIVVFDAPPVLVVTDAGILAPKMDKIVLIYEIGKTARHALARSKTQLEAVDGKIAGWS